MAALRQSRHAVKRGNTRTPEVMNWSTPGCRTRNQHEAVLAHFRRHPAAWVAGNPFASDRPGQMFKCGFAVNYFDVRGRYCGFWVTPAGVVRDHTIGEIKFAHETEQVIASYGEFRG